MALSGDDEDYKRIMDINVLGVLHCYKHAAKQMIKQGRGGRIVGKLFLTSCLLTLTRVNAILHIGACSGAGKKGGLSYSMRAHGLLTHCAC